MAGSRRKKALDDHEEHFDESWLVTYADMMTLLVALFMVLFSISSVNISKFEDLQRSLANAFSGRVLPGGKGIQDAGGSDPTANSIITTPSATSLTPNDSGEAGDRDAAAKKEQEDFEKLKAAVDQAVRERGLGGKVRTRISKRGLEVRLLTDDLVFDSGSAVVKAGGADLITEVGRILNADKRHAVIVEGHTDDVPISTVQFPTNWELSTARSTNVLRTLARGGVKTDRLSAMGRADRDPIADNDSAGGRALNRRVEILLPRTIITGKRGGTSDDFDPAVRPESPSIRPDALEASP